MQRVCLTFSIAFLAASAALAQDAGTATDAGTAPTDAGTAPADGGAVSCDPDGATQPNNQGECTTPDTVTYCAADTETVVSYTCTEYFGTDIANGGCEAISDAYGVDCVTTVGEPCLFQDNSGNAVPVFCEGDTPACIVDLAAGGSACGTAAACVPAENFAPVCDGNKLTFGCVATQPFQFDCATAGSGAACSGGACTNIPEGGPCGDGFECATGLECDQVDQACVPEGSGEGEGEGEPAADAGATECAADEVLDRGSCVKKTGGGCFGNETNNTGAPAALAFVFLGLVAVARRRR